MDQHYRSWTEQI